MVEASCETGNEPSVSVKFGKSPDHLSDFHLNKNSAA